MQPEGGCGWLNPHPKEKHSKILCVNFCLNSDFMASNATINLFKSTSLHNLET